MASQRTPSPSSPPIVFALGVIVGLVIGGIAGYAAYGLTHSNDARPLAPWDEAPLPNTAPTDEYLNPPAPDTPPAEPHSAMEPQQNAREAAEPAGVQDAPDTTDDPHDGPVTSFPSDDAEHRSADHNAHKSADRKPKQRPTPSVKGDDTPEHANNSEHSETPPEAVQPHTPSDPDYNEIDPGGLRLSNDPDVPFNPPPD